MSLYYSWTFCASRQRLHIPGALSISQGAVPVQARGLEHMAPTYSVGTRDRPLSPVVWIVRLLKYGLHFDRYKISEKTIAS
jgi:hypothetical protein